jgi:hypothetical protein
MLLSELAQVEGVGRCYSLQKGADPPIEAMNDRDRTSRHAATSLTTAG